jgi:hypothetical protein
MSRRRSGSVGGGSGHALRGKKEARVVVVVGEGEMAWGARRGYHNYYYHYNTITITFNSLITGSLAPALTDEPSLSASLRLSPLARSED